MAKLKFREKEEPRYIPDQPFKLDYLKIVEGTRDIVKAWFGEEN